MAKLSVTKPQSMYLLSFHLCNKNMFLGKQLDIMRVLFLSPQSGLVIPECTRSCCVLDGKPEAALDCMGPRWLAIVRKSPAALCLESC